VNPFFKSIFRQSLVFLAYLGLGSLMLRHHGGGADIGFMLFMILAGLGHGIFLFVKTVGRKRGEESPYSDYDVLTYFVMITLFIVNFEWYITLMWQLTS
jgi:hypothetical protein